MYGGILLYGIAGELTMLGESVVVHLVCHQASGKNPRCLNRVPAIIANQTGAAVDASSFGSRDFSHSI